MKTKTKKLVYALAIGVPALVVFLYGLIIAGIGFKFTFCFTVLTGLAFWFVSRATIQCVEQKFAAKDWQLTAYCFTVFLGWSLAVFLEKTWMVSGALALMAVGCTMFLGLKYDDENENGIPDCVENVVKKVVRKIRERRKMTVDQIKEELQYKPIDDVVGNPDDLERPMCTVDGQPMTINEAIEAGRQAEAYEALAYVNETLAPEAEKATEEAEEKKETEV